MSSNKKKYGRTDVLSGKAAEEFAREHTDFYLYQDAINNCGFKLLKSLDSDKYYLAKINKKEKFFSERPTYFVNVINKQPLDPRLINGEPELIESITGCRVDVCVDGKDKPKRLYFGSSLYQFKREKDRDNFELFCLECCGRKPKFDKLDKLSEYFLDKNFVLMAKDEAFFLAFRVADDLTTIGKNLLEHKIKKEIDNRVEKYANKLSQNGQMGE